MHERINHNFSMDNEDSPLLHGKVGTILIAMGSASFVVTVFHLVILCRTHHHVTNQHSQQQRRQQQQATRCTGENALVVPHLIPAHKYQKKKSDGDDNEDDTCAVCLGEFEEGEELRMLPECMHYFHVACIDTWLYSHSNCPVCRGRATPSPAAVERRSEPELINTHHHHTIEIVV